MISIFRISYFLKNGSITRNGSSRLIKIENKYILPPNAIVIERIVSGNGDYLSSKGISVTVSNGTKTRLVLIFFK